MGPELERGAVDDRAPSARLPKLRPASSPRTRTIRLPSRSLSQPDADSKLLVGIGRTVTDRRHGCGIKRSELAADHGWSPHPGP